MMRKYALTLITTLALPLNASAEGIRNGQFEFFTPDNPTAIQVWNLDTDGSNASNDFSLTVAAAYLNVPNTNIQGFVGKIEADYAHNQVLYANTLYQPLDLTLPTGNQFRLSFDWLFAGEATSSDESFSVALGGFDTQGNFNYYGADGQLGLITQQSQYGNGHFSVLFDPSVATPQNFTLEFQLVRGYDNLGSYLVLDNVQLEAVPIASVPLPAAGVLFALGVSLLARRQSHR